MNPPGAFGSNLIPNERSWVLWPGPLMLTHLPLIVPFKALAISASVSLSVLAIVMSSPSALDATSSPTGTSPGAAVVRSNPWSLGTITEVQLRHTQENSTYRFAVERFTVLGELARSV